MEEWRVEGGGLWAVCGCEGLQVFIYLPYGMVSIYDSMGNTIQRRQETSDEWILRFWFGGEYLSLSL